MSRAHLFLFVLAVACGGGKSIDTSSDSGDASPSEYLDLGNTGTACVLPEGGTWGDGYDTGESQTLEADAVVTVLVELDDCYSSSVSGENASCTVALEDNQLVVTSEGGYTLPRGASNKDCNVLAATCTGPALAEGSYSLSYRGLKVPFTIPSAGTPCAP